MHGKIVPNWMWEYTIYCVNYLLILIQFILVIIVITAITTITVIMAINARMANTLFPDANVDKQNLCPLLHTLHFLDINKLSLHSLLTTL